MIGAGFSRNAEPSAAAARPFPTWAELADRLAGELDPFGVRSSDPMRVAQEYDAMFGRARLDDAIRSCVPDSEHSPSELHRRLLALPWADVFTTNWDTLLERAAPEAHERAYDIVATPSQVPSAAFPRIVKLHGTLPASGPFILTEEDFRTYPRRFAPFVNMVQQAMMETSMVLLGFSGDDPNFLQWSGWVRDNLGEHAPRIYLVGWLKLAPQQRRMLEERRVISIDLSELPDARDWPAEARYRWAMEWFLHAMEGGRPPRLMRWPDRSPEPGGEAKHLGWTMPRHGAAGSFELWPKAPFGASDDALVEELRPLIAAWRDERINNPGWWIIPYAVRERMWSRSKRWLGDIAKRAGLLPMPERLNALAESLRRLEMLLLDASLVQGLPAQLKAVLESISADGRTWAADGKTGTLDAAASEEWRFCVLAAARLARTSCDLAAHEASLLVLEAGSRANPTVAHEVTFERALRCRQFLYDDELDAVLDGWDTSGVDPVWGIRKAGLLAGAGRDSDARTVLVDALRRARRNRRSDALDLAALSREGWGVVLGVAWHRNFDGSTNGLVDARDSDPWGRWEDLRPYGCDGWSDVRDLMAAMREPPPPPSQRRVRGFEPGTSSQTFNFSSDLPDAYRAGRQMLRLADATALPPVANRTFLLRDALERAVAACALHDEAAPLILALAHASEAGNDKAPHRYLTRARVATLTDDEVELLVMSLLRRLTAARARAGHGHDFWPTRFRVAAEMLSRLMPRCSDDQVRATFDFACEIEESGWAPGYRHAGVEIEHLFSRVIARLPDGDLPSSVIRLAGLPFPDSRQSGPSSRRSDPMAFFERRQRKLEGAAGTETGCADPGLVSRLVTAGRNSPHIRALAITRLYTLERAGLLSPEGRIQLGELIWADENSAQPNLPRDLAYHPWAILFMPERREGEAGDAFRQEFLRGRDGRRLGEMLWNIGVATHQARLNGSPFTFSHEDFIAVEKLVLAWAQQPLPAGPKFGKMIEDDEKIAQEGLSHILVAAQLAADIIAAVQAKVHSLQAAPLRAPSGLPLLPGLVLSIPNLSSSAASWLRRGLVSADIEIVEEAIRAVDRWLDAAQRNPGMAAPPDDLLEEVAAMLTARRPGTLGFALDLTRWLFEKRPDKLPSSLVRRSDLALAYLFNETSYANEVRAGHESELDAPLLRQRAMALAGAMRRAGHGGGEGVEQWITHGVNDPLFEVRRAADVHEE